MTIREMLEVTVNNSQCVLLEFKENATARDKIMTGLLDGDETMIRVTKGPGQYYTIFRKDGTRFTWHYGRSGYTLVSDRTHELRRQIEEIIRTRGIDIEKRGVRDDICGTDEVS